MDNRETDEIFDEINRAFESGAYDKGAQPEYTESRSAPAQADDVMDFSNYSRAYLNAYKEAYGTQYQRPPRENRNRNKQRTREDRSQYRQRTRDEVRMNSNRSARRDEPRRRAPRRRSGGGFMSFLKALVAIIFILALAYTFLCKPPKDPNTAAPRHDNFATVLIAGTDGGNNRTDTIILASIDKKNRDVSLLSIPRDTYVDAPYSVPKINSASGYAGGGEAGMNELMDQVEKTIGFRPDGYVMVSFDAFVKLVDHMGGVDFDVPVDMQYNDPTQDLYIDIPAGQQHLNGEDALKVVRFRSGYAMADLTRVEVQRSFVKAAMNQWLKPINIIRLPGAIAIANERITTDLNMGNMIWCAGALMRCDKSDIQTQTLPGQAKTINGGSYFVADKDATAQLMSDVYSPYLSF
ncbi:MAG: LCP family protein [Oscillospiraceae bacterium]|nr:LCP family protein [Oscillospiraceae bacterium]